MTSPLFDIVFVNASDADPISADLRNQYYAVRHKAFSRYTDSFYTTSPDAFDLRPSTVFCLAVRNGKVLGGAQMVMHAPGTDELTRSEYNNIKHRLSNLLPYVDTKNLRYGECSGGAVHADAMLELGVPLHISTDILHVLLSSVKTGAIQSEGKPLDLVTGYARAAGLHPFARATKMAGISAIVREDLVPQPHEAVLKIVPGILSINTAIDLQADRMSAAGAQITSLEAYVSSRRQSHLR